MGKYSKKTNTTESNSAELFPIDSISGKKVQVGFQAPDLSSFGGLLLMREFESRCDIIKHLSECLEDKRTSHLIKHTQEEMLSQRIYQIAAGYEDADDCDLLRNDSLLKICSNRQPTDSPLSSQPTMSRLENNVTIREVYRMCECFVEEFINSYSEAPEAIILDCDDSNFNAYGCQQGVLFNNYYSEYCYMPLFIFEGASGKMILPLLRQGRPNKSINIFGILRRLIARLHRQWPTTHFIVRGDGHFASKELMQWSQEKNYVEFIFGLGSNAVLARQTQELEEKAKKRYNKWGEAVRFYKSFSYKAGSWSMPQRVIAKVEYSSAGLNVHYVVTSFHKTRSTFLYETLYCNRGVMELYIKELKTYLAADRTSCHRFLANQFRLLLHAAAYVLLHGIKQSVCKGTFLEGVSIITFRQKILLSAVHVKTQKTKIIIDFHKEHPHRKEIEIILQRLWLWKKAA